MAGIFQTPPNEQSFSSLIDDAILATGRPNALISAIQHANLCVRECQGLSLFAQDLVEDQLSVGSTVPYIWNRPAFFRKLRTAEYGYNDPTSGHLRNKRYPKFLLPGKIQKEHCDYFYAASNYFVFSGVHTGDVINTATYYWSIPLAYYALAGAATELFPGGPYSTRLAYFDTILMQWMYLQVDGTTYAATTGDPAVDEQYRNLSANWLSSDWRALILSGTKAKIWNSVGDARGNVEYSLYKQVQQELRISSGYEAEGF
jgi:hypothetical protein